MKYSSQQYADALLSALEGKADSDQKKVFRSFLGCISKNGDWFLLPTILRKVEKKHLSKAGLHKVDISVTSALSSEQKKIIDDVLQGKAKVDVSYDPELLAGVKIIVDHEILIDATGKHMVEQLF